MSTRSSAWFTHLVADVTSTERWFAGNGPQARGTRPGLQQADATLWISLRALGPNARPCCGLSRTFGMGERASTSTRACRRSDGRGVVPGHRVRAAGIRMEIVLASQAHGCAARSNPAETEGGRTNRHPPPCSLGGGDKDLTGFATRSGWSQSRSKTQAPPQRVFSRSRSRRT